MARFACSVVFFCDGILAYCEQKSAIMCVKLTILSTLVSAFICLGSEEHQRKQNALSVTRNIQRAYTCTGGRIQPIRVVPTGKRFAYLFRIILNIHKLQSCPYCFILLYTINLCSLGGQRVNRYSQIQADTIRSKATLNSELRIPIFTMCLLLFRISHFLGQSLSKKYRRDFPDGICFISVMSCTAFTYGIHFEHLPENTDYFPEEACKSCAVTNMTTVVSRIFRSVNKL